MNIPPVLPLNSSKALPPCLAIGRVITMIPLLLCGHTQKKQSGTMAGKHTKQTHGGENEKKKKSRTKAASLICFPDFVLGCHCSFAYLPVCVHFGYFLLASSHFGAPLVLAHPLNFHIKIVLQNFCAWQSCTQRNALLRHV